MENYFIKKEYKINEINITNDKVSETNYWNKQRTLAAELYQFPVYEFLSKYIKENNTKRIMDIGCGVGRKLVHIKKENPTVEIIGIDQKDPIEYCKNTYNFGTWYADDFENTHLSQDVKSKLIISSDVIEHLMNPNLLLEYIKSRLDGKGVVILSTPERDSLRGVNSNYSPNKHHIREWNYAEFEKYLESQGFEILDHFLQFPIKMKCSRIFFNEIIRRAIKFKPLKYNQVVVAKVK
jgi:trans-aconitate methyltransferase